jgi:hypothetical protein
MNKNFSFSRFRLLTKKLFFENWLTLLGLLILAFVIILIFYLLLLSNDENGDLYISYRSFSEVQLSTFSLTLIASGAIFTIFSNLIFSEKKRSSAFLQLPATHLEKYFSLLCVSFFVFIFAFSIIYLPLDLIFTSLAHQNWEKALINAKLLKENTHFIEGIINQEPKLTFLHFKVIAYTLLVLAYIHSIFMLGALYFQRVSYIKTIIFLFVLGMVLFLYNYLIAKFLYIADKDSGVYIPDAEEVVKYQLLEIWTYVAYFMPFILWGIAYTRLKDKEE